MSNKTRDQLVTIVADALGKSINASAISGSLLGTRCIDFLNWGQERIARSYNFDELNVTLETAVTVTDIKNYPMITGTNNLGMVRPKDVASIRLIDAQNSRVLSRWNQRKFDTKFPLPSNYSTGYPSIYIKYGNQIELFRIPNAAYSLYIRYPQWPTSLSTSSSVSDFDTKDQLLISAAILEGYLHFEEYEDVKIWMARFIGQLSDVIKTTGDMDWEPTREGFSTGQAGYISGEPWTSPDGQVGDPLYGYSD
jgi:hypothetical protein